MIASVSGELRKVLDDRVLLAVGPVVLEAMVCAADIAMLRDLVGTELTLHTALYIQGDASGGGSLEPRLLGFLKHDDKRFFEKFVTVKGIGPRKALKALAIPVGEIAMAIESRDARALIELPEIGRRLAETIIAELSGKVTEFATPLAAARNGAKIVSRGTRSEVEEDAIATLVQLGEKRADAELLLDRAKAGGTKPATASDFVKEMLRIRSSR